MKMILRIPFFSLNNANIGFIKISDFIWKNFIAIETLSTTQKVQLIDNKKFAKRALNENTKIFMVYIAVLLVISIDSS